MEAMVEHIAPNLDLISTPENVERIVLIKPDCIGRIIDLGTQKYDYVLIDIGSSFSTYGENLKLMNLEIAKKENEKNKLGLYPNILIQNSDQLSFKSDYIVLKESPISLMETIMLKEQDLEKIRKEMYPNHILMEVFTDSIGSVWVHLSKRVGVGKWLSDTEDWM